jgi:hypothetical protein
LTTALVLQLPDFDRDFIVECDTSGSGAGAVLHQGREAVAFFSHQMAPHHTKLVAYECELIGMVQAVKHWRAYLWGRAFLVKTNHYSLKYLLDQCLATIPQHQWLSKLMGFDFAVEYKPGASNTVADALSRRSEEEFGELAALSAPSFTVFDTLRVVLDETEALRQLRAEVAAGGRGDKWQVVDGLITKAGKIYVPADSPHLPAILSAVTSMCLAYSPWSRSMSAAYYNRSMCLESHGHTSPWTSSRAAQSWGLSSMGRSSSSRRSGRSRIGCNYRPTPRSMMSSTSGSSSHSKANHQW